GRTAYYFEGYNLMGDPSLNMAVWGVEGIEDQSGGYVNVNLNILIANPVRSAAIVTLTGYGPSELNVFDLTGRLVETPFRGAISGTQSLNWDVSNLVPGMYFLQLVQGNELSTARVMVIR
ncbi:MAG: T9SS type A sorting domain-containing protein, partial [Candidatus Fermentibacteraceae bacterium]|nr:T9SS type A sorting domain-containing protein [Candidatus Fermentibacteraceae bacterium]